jgi:antitoxin ParD1/3/4
MHISLTDRLEAWVREKVESGLYNNASEVIREALRAKILADQTYQEKLDALKAEIQKGLDQAERGEFVELTREQVKKRLMAAEARKVG